jgi:hypothetical protein
LTGNDQNGAVHGLNWQAGADRSARGSSRRGRCAAG